MGKTIGVQDVRVGGFGEEVLGLGKRLRMVPFLLASFAVFGCDPAKESFAKCEALAEEGYPGRAIDYCREAVAASPNSTSGKAAAEKVAQLEAQAYRTASEAKRLRLEAERAREEAERRQWPSMPNRLWAAVHARGTTDSLEGGRATPVIDVIAGVLGKPTGSYEEMGTFVYYVWGTRLGSGPSLAAIKQSPFVVMTMKGLICSRANLSHFKFYSYGKPL